MSRAFSKRATRVVGASTFTVQAGLVPQSPLQPAKRDPLAALATRETLVPGATSTAQAGPQSMPEAPPT